VARLAQGGPVSATEHLEGFCRAITERRPLVLLLGQDAWRSGSRPDPILEAAFKRLQRSASGSFPQLLQAEPLPDDFFQWMAESYTRQPEAPWLEPIGRLPLNAAFTSSVDPALARAFRVNGRDVEPVLSSQDNPSAPRNRRNLHLTYLFGRAG